MLCYLDVSKCNDAGRIRAINSTFEEKKRKRKRKRKREDSMCEDEVYYNFGNCYGDWQESYTGRLVSLLWCKC
jgi:hypothetical protein